MLTAQTPDEEIQPALDKLKRLAGITIPIRKKVMVMHRLRRRMEELRYARVADYLAEVERSAQERQVFINLLTTNETSFFRTPQLWSFVREELLPRLATRSAAAPLRLWSAASSTGEEPYSLAMAALDAQERYPGSAFHVLATDIDTAVLAKAEAGVYEGRNLVALQATHPELVRRHFEPVPEGARVRETVRRNMTFRRQNLFELRRGSNAFDAIFVRNVMIYFDAPERTQVIFSLADCLRPGGFLVIGESESISGVHPELSFVRPMVYRKAGP